MLPVGQRLALDAACFPGRSELRHYDFTLLFDVVTITGLPALITRAVNPSSELLRIEMMPKPATGIFGDEGNLARD